VRFLLDHDVPDDIIFSLTALAHDVVRLREVLPTTTTDEDVLRFATTQQRILITCNRDDFLAVGSREDHAGVIILIRRRSRALERAALVRLLDNAGEDGIHGNINFA
jgi:predicted nuclease of predicted toxin-antitoxin system